MKSKKLLAAMVIAASTIFGAGSANAMFPELYSHFRNVWAMANYHTALADGTAFSWCALYVSKDWGDADANSKAGPLAQYCQISAVRLTQGFPFPPYPY